MACKSKTVLANQLNKITSNKTSSRRNAFFTASAVTVLVLCSVGYIEVVWLTALFSFGMLLGISTSKNDLLTTPVKRRSHGAANANSCSSACDLPDFGTTLPNTSAGGSGVKRCLLTALMLSASTPEGEASGTNALIIRPEGFVTGVLQRIGYYTDYQKLFFIMLLINVVLVLTIVTVTCVVPVCMKVCPMRRCLFRCEFEGRASGRCPNQCKRSAVHNGKCSC